ncbi:MAG: exopolyphosphatase [Rhodospirillaceae bacterium]|nr:exopolyphosphatase [Rhodospirillaceae bacterium]
MEKKPKLYKKSVGVIDVGSNTVRLVVYANFNRVPIAVYNEKAQCALARNLDTSGVLNPEGVKKTLELMQRFSLITKKMHIDKLGVLGTSALRDAKNGDEFVSLIRQKTGLNINVLSGKKEAELSALGVLCGIPLADGTVADLGGGSLELIDVGNANRARGITLPLGTIRLADFSGSDISLAKKLVDSMLVEQSWIKKTKGRTLYAVGGAWRALARICVAQMDYPLHVLDNFTLTRSKANALFKIISHLGPESLSRIVGISQGRAQSLPLAAMVLRRLMSYGQPSKVVFSVYGMREGFFFRSLTRQEKSQDPLISMAEGICQSSGRDPEIGYEVYRWLSPLFARESAVQKRLRLAGCILRDAYAAEHPDYRAEQAFLRLLRLPFMGLEHEDRAGLALALFYRYRTFDIIPSVEKAKDMLSANRLERVKGIGLGLRLTYALSAGMPQALGAIQIELTKKFLILNIKNQDYFYNEHSFLTRLNRLAQHFGRQAQIYYL